MLGAGLVITGLGGVGSRSRGLFCSIFGFGAILPINHYVTDPQSS